MHLNNQNKEESEKPRFIMWRSFYKVFKKTVIILLALWVLLFAALFLRLAHSPYSLDVHLPKIIHWLEPEGVDISIKHMDIRYDNSLKVYVEGLRVVNHISHNEMILDQATFILSNHNLVLFRVAPKHIILGGVTLPVVMDKERLEVAGFELPKTDGVQGSIVAFLNNTDAPYFVRSIKRIQLSDLSLTFSDYVHGHTWYLEKAEGQFLRNREGENKLHVEAMMSQSLEEEASPAEIDAFYQEGQDKINLKVMFKNSDTKLLEGYLPLQGVVEMKGDVWFESQINKLNHIENPHFGFKVGKGSVHIQKAYNFPFTFDSAEFEGRYKGKNKQGEDTLIIDYLTVKDSRGDTIDISGYAENLKTNPFVDVELKMSPTYLSSVASYLPDHLMKNTTDWIDNHVHKGRVTNLVLKYKGSPKELPNCGVSCGFDGEFDFQNLTLSFLNHTPAVTGVDGHFVMRDDFIYIQGYEGFLGSQHVSDISVTIDGHFSPEVEDKIYIETKASGAVQEVLETLEKELQHGKLSGGHVAGRHRSQVNLSFPLKHPSFEELKLNVVSDLSDVRTESMAYTGGVPVVLPTATLRVTESDLDMIGKGSLDGIVGEVKWHENMKQAFKQTSIHMKGVLSAEKALSYVEDLGVDVKGDSKIDLHIQHQPSNGWWSYNVTTDMQKAEVSHHGLNWHKTEGQDLQVLAKGDYDWAHKRLMARSATLKGEGVDVKGKFDFTGGENKKLTYDFPTFKLGNNNIKTQLSGKKLVIEGERLDLSSQGVGEHLSGAQSQKEEEPFLPFFKTGEIKVDLKQIDFIKGIAEDVSLTAERENFIFKSGALKSKVAKKNIFEGTLQTTESGKVIDFYAKEAGEVLAATGLSQSLRRGEMMGHLNYHYNEQKDIIGEGHISILNTGLVKAPILAKILSYLSLEQLLTDQKGILFDEVSAPFNLIGPIIKFKDISMKGPSIGLNFRGNYNMDKSELDVKGRLTPVAGLNKVIGNIPVVGGILTGTQEGLLVADFSVKGPVNNAKVSANPLSLVTPGLVKDIIDVVTGEDDFMDPADETDPIFNELAE